jgi:hypothetical protein
MFGQEKVNPDEFMLQMMSAALATDSPPEASGCGQLPARSCIFLDRRWEISLPQRPVLDRASGAAP